LTYPEAVLGPNSFAAIREFLGAAMASRNCNIAGCVVIGPPNTCPFAAELSMEQGLTEIRMPSQWDFPNRPVRAMCRGHSAPVQHSGDELDAACATAAPVPPRRANSRINARTRFMTFSYHRRTF
jgi:hypothetical protein